MNHDPTTRLIHPKKLPKIFKTYLLCTTKVIYDLPITYYHVNMELVLLNITEMILIVNVVKI